jgi:6-phosphogluconolactonase
MELRKFHGREELSHAAAKIFVETASEAVNNRGKFSVALCSGNSAFRFFELLATSPYKEQVPWKAVNIFWADEQWVFHNYLRNNARIAFELFLNHVPVSPQQICRISGELGPLDAAMQYEYILQEYFKEEPPKLDLVFLNLGEDGQVASLLPGSEVLAEKKHWVKSVYHSEQKMYKITLTAHFINNARRIIFLIMGSEKASVVKRLLDGNNFPLLPAELVLPEEGELIYLLDDDAASEILL